MESSESLSSARRRLRLMGNQAIRQHNGGEPLQDDISALAMLPRVTLTNGTARAANREHGVATYVRLVGRTLAASVYQETLERSRTNGGATGVVSSNDCYRTWLREFRFQLRPLPAPWRGADVDAGRGTI